MSNFYIPRYSGIYYTSTTTSSPNWLPQVSQSYLTKLHNTASRTTLSQTFINPSNLSPITSAKYTFPLYDSCAVVSFRCHVGSRFIDGIVKEKEEASVGYQNAIDRREPASLLEQNTPDVFSTSLGNVAPGETVRVEIEYILELKHDAEVDGLRFTIPTSIAPRYGEPPSGLGAYAAHAKGINISVEISMSSNIKSVQSPSHPISIHLGGHSEDTPDDAFNPQHALAMLGQTSTELGSDFILLIKCANLSSPCALLETHPTIPNSQALMVTLVPKFRLPEGPKPEIVFIADRSGSMTDRIAPLKSSLTVFLKSLPLGVKFNICSFGTRHSFLWDTSRPYADDTLEEAQRYVDGMQADFGGTEILPPIRSTITKRLRDLMLEIMVLTDGQVWGADQLFKYVEKETANGDVRLFSLGIGQDVSHSLIDGLARVGRGFSQVVSDEREGMESKVARMLRGGLSAHVNDYRLEWEGKPSEEDAASEDSGFSVIDPGRISLFDTTADTETPVSFSRLPDFIVPSVLQAPYKLPPLFPFSRTTAYAILSTETQQAPSHVWLRGTTPSGTALELEIAVQPVPTNGQTIHQLAARKILQELEEGTGYIHCGKYGGVGRESHPRTFDEWVKREGVRVGLKYGLASKWTSFLAVLQTRERMEPSPQEQDAAESSQTQTQTGLDDQETYELVDFDDDVDTNHAAPGGSMGPVPTMMAFMPPPPAVDYPKKSSSFSKFSSRPEKGSPLPVKEGKLKPYGFSSYSKPSPKSLFGSLQGSEMKSKKGGGMKSSAFSSSGSIFVDSPPSPPSLSSMLTSEETALSNDESSDHSLSYPGWDSSFKPCGKKSKGAFSFPKLSSASKLYDKQRPSKGDSFGASDIAITYSQSNAPPVERLSETDAQPLSQRTRALISLQTFEGSFSLDAAISQLLCVPIADLEARLRNLAWDSGLSQEHLRSLWATMLAIKLFETKLSGERRVWELVVEKAKAWIRGLVLVGDAENELEKLAEEVLGV